MIIKKPLSIRLIILLQILTIVAFLALNFHVYVYSENLEHKVVRLESDSFPVPESGDVISDHGSPIIHELSHQKIQVNDKLTIIGEYFGESSGKVVFVLAVDNDVRKEVLVDSSDWTDNQIQVTVPAVEGDRTYYIRPYSNENFLFNWTSPNAIYILPEYREYVVELGDSLYKIAQNELGSGERFNEIIELNKKIYPQIESTTVLGIGSLLRIPKD